jgi:hypothetical protein
MMDARAGQAGVRELYVVIPARLHRALFRRKLLTGHTVQATVAEALRAYFDGLEPDLARALERHARRG